MNRFNNLMIATFLVVLTCVGYSKSAEPPVGMNPGSIEGSISQVFLDVKSYGAIGNGKTNDTVAIQTADKAAEALHGVLLFPPGTYLITSTLKINSPVRWEGGFSASNSSTNSTIIKADAVLDPMINIGHSNVEIDHIRVDGNGEAIEGIRTQTSGNEPRAYNVVLRNVTIQDFRLANPSVVALDLGDYGNPTNRYACSDCSFYDVEVESGADFQVGRKAAGIGVYISREENQFYDVHIGGFNIGVLFGAGPYGGASDNGFFGGSIADDRTADLSLTSSAVNVDNSFYNLWFEGSMGPIVGNIPITTRTDNQQFDFYSCHFNSYSTTSIFDLRHLVGSVTIWNGAFDISSSGTVITSVNGSFQTWGSVAGLSSLKFVGSNYKNNGDYRYSVTMPAATIPANSCSDQTAVTIDPHAVGLGFAIPVNWWGGNDMVHLIYWSGGTKAFFKWCNMSNAAITTSSDTINFRMR